MVFNEQEPDLTKDVHYTCMYQSVLLCKRKNKTKSIIVNHILLEWSKAIFLPEGIVKMIKLSTDSRIWISIKICNHSNNHRSYQIVVGRSRKCKFIWITYPLFFSRNRYRKTHFYIIYYVNTYIKRNQIWYYIGSPEWNETDMVRTLLGTNKQRTT